MEKKHKNVVINFRKLSCFKNSEDRAVRYALLERAFRAENSANVGFSTYMYYFHRNLIPKGYGQLRL
jgi:hypothetical protein